MRIGFHSILILLLVAVGMATLVRLGIDNTRVWRRRGFRVPNSLLPGPPRLSEQLAFRLDEKNSRQMRGIDAPDDERWADLAGNYYHADFIARFRYAGSHPNAPTVRVQWEPRAETFRGRLEARGLKPNFAYQIKLQGDFRIDPEGAEHIGYQGRWRLPGFPRRTNFTDRDFRRFEPRQQVEAYLIFDFLVTDRDGNGARDFALDSSLHVLWNRDRQRRPNAPEDVAAFTVAAEDPSVYARPKAIQSVEYLWAERAHWRYRNPHQVIRLPPGFYRANLVLTEESFHASDRDGGFWATVFRLPVSFAITPNTPRQFK